MTPSILARQPNPLPNPFRPGNGVPPPYLAGRDQLLVAFEDWLIEQPPLYANLTLIGLRGTGKTVLLGEFATRAERAGWLTLHRELGDRHRDDIRLAEAIAEDCDALIGRADALAAVGQAVERGARWLRPKRVGVGGTSLDPSYTADTPAAADVMERGFAQLDAVLSHTERPGALLLYDEAHVQDELCVAFLQFFGAFVCGRIGLEHIELRDFERVEPALLHELDLAFFEDRFLTASRAEQELLVRMAGHSGDRVSAMELRDRGGGPPECQRVAAPTGHPWPPVPAHARQLQVRFAAVRQIPAPPSRNHKDHRPCDFRPTAATAGSSTRAMNTSGRDA